MPTMLLHAPFPDFQTFLRPCILPQFYLTPVFPGGNQGTKAFPTQQASFFELTTLLICRGTMSLPLDQEGEGARSEVIHNCFSLVIEFLLWQVKISKIIDKISNILSIFRSHRGREPAIHNCLCQVMEFFVASQNQFDSKRDGLVLATLRYLILTHEIKNSITNLTLL